MGNESKVYVYRVTRPSLYQSDQTSLSARQGYYYEIYGSGNDPLRKVVELAIMAFPKEPLDFQDWNGGADHGKLVARWGLQMVDPQPDKPEDDVVENFVGRKLTVEDDVTEDEDADGI